MSSIPASVLERSSKVAALAAHFELDQYVASNLAEGYRLRLRGQEENSWTLAAAVEARRLLGPGFAAFDAALAELMQARFGKA